ncbi:MAG TPA: hypothetical protein VFA41_19465 [Ktedonobacteraceae bacterium]|jgi:hypothetical protein|nr:hypothetical protein [Ktedonobacteraceae bacterium]
MAASVSKRVPLLINRNFALLWIGQSPSQIGDFFFETTLVLWIATQLAKGQSWNALASLYRWGRFNCDIQRVNLPGASRR